MSGCWRIDIRKEGSELMVVRRKRIDQDQDEFDSIDMIVRPSTTPLKCYLRYM